VKQTEASIPPAGELEIAIDRDHFLVSLIRELALSLENVIGLEQASGFFSLVGQSLGDMFNAAYREAYGVEKLNSDQVAEVLVDLKRRIEGEFQLEKLSDDRIDLTATACPFAENVKGCTSLCMLTSNVFGIITAENLGYAKVLLDKTIAAGDAGCSITVFHRSTEACEAETGREYFGKTKPS
jgi:predicted ArsR family transcriptional regulator